MTDSIMDSEEIFLFMNRWSVGQHIPVPKDGFTGSEHHNVASAKYPLGQTIEVQCDGSVGLEGPSQFTYLRMYAADPTLAVKMLCACDGTNPFYVTNAKDGDLGTPGAQPCAMSLGAMTATYYGWFWTGGVCPEQYVSTLGGSYGTTGGVAAGCAMVVADANTTAGTYGDFKFGIQTTAAGESPVGFALATDD